MNIGLVLFAVVILFIIFYMVSIYNHLVSARNYYKNAFSQIDVQLTRRYELIPNLVEIAKTYMVHEKETLERVIVARNQAVNSLNQARQDLSNQNIASLSQAENALGQTLGRLFALSEDYPDLKANQNMMQLTEEVTSTENRVSYARQAYNDCVMDYNMQCEKFPSNVIAGVFNFRQVSYLKLDTEEMKKAPEIKF